MSLASDTRGSDLCRSCGLCCDGTLFNWVPVEASERQALDNLRLKIVDGPDGPRFKLGSPQLQATVCGVYDDRPLMCRSFTCKLYKRHVAGEISLEDASAVVTEVQEARRQLHARIAELPGGGAHTPVADLDPRTLLLRLAIRRLVARRFQDPDVQDPDVPGSSFTRSG